MKSDFTLGVPCIVYAQVHFLSPLFISISLRNLVLIVLPLPFLR